MFRNATLDGLIIPTKEEILANWLNGSSMEYLTESGILVDISSADGVFDQARSYWRSDVTFCHKANFSILAVTNETICFEKAGADEQFRLVSLAEIILRSL